MRETGTEDDLVEIASFGFLHEAELAASALEAADIESSINDRFVIGVTPGPIFAPHGVGLMVRSSDVLRAREILQSSARPVEQESESD